MSTVEFIFSDESGGIKAESYYLRTALMVNAGGYFQLQRQFIELKKEYGIPLDEEFKAADVWHLLKYQENGTPLPKRHKQRLEKYTKKHYSYYWEFILKSLELIPDTSTIIAVWTYFFNTPFKAQEEIEKDFLQVLMLRIEDELKEQGRHGIILYDQSSIEKLSNYYNLIFHEGKFVNSYTHIKDSIAFEVSTFSSGLQIVDYTASVIHNSLRGYGHSVTAFKKYIRPIIRRNEGRSLIQTGFIPLYVKGYHKEHQGEKLIDEISERLDLQNYQTI